MYNLIITIYKFIIWGDIMQKTKVIVTLNKSNMDKENLKTLINHGMNVARINLLHYSYDEAKLAINNLREADEELNTLTAVLINIHDNKIRTNSFIKNGFNLKKDQYFSFLCGSEIVGDSTRCSISNSYLHKILSPSDKLFIDNGLIQFEVIEINGREIKCKVIVPGFISSNKQLNCSNIKEHTPLITTIMDEDIKFACNVKSNFISVSSVRNKSDMSLYFDKILEYTKNSLPQLLCNIENIDCVNNIDDILNFCDGVIICRSEMGISIKYEEIPYAQKDIINKCIKNNKISIVANQILSSMTEFNKPNRSEISDIFTIISDNANAIMLTKSTSIGKHPVEVLDTLCKLLKDGESKLEIKTILSENYNNKTLSYDEIMSNSIVNMANNFPTKAILISTTNGTVVKEISRYRPNANIIAVTNNKQVAKNLILEYGVTPFIYDDFINDNKFLEDARNFVLKNKIANRLDTVIVLTSDRNSSFKNDTLKIMTI